MEQRSLLRSLMVARADAAEPRHSEATLIEHHGELLLAWSAFGAETRAEPSESAASREWTYSRDNNAAEIRLRRSRDGGHTWSQAELLVADVGGINTMQPAFIELADGRLGLSYSVRDRPGRARRLFAASDDAGRSWTNPIDMTGFDGYLTAAHHRLVRHSSGRLIQLCHRLRDDELDVVISISDDDASSWFPLSSLRMPVDLTREGTPHAHQGGLWEASACELPDGDLLLVGRTSLGQVYAARSSDAGSTWTAPTPTDVVAPSAPSILLREGNALMLIHNSGYDPAAVLAGTRSRLTTSTSTDGGHTWSSAAVLFDDPRRWFHYPAALRRHDHWLLALSITDLATRYWDLVLARLPFTTVIGDQT